jgi:hypothetical protein
MAFTDELKPEETGPNPLVEKAKENLRKFDTAKPPPPQTKPLIEQSNPSTAAPPGEHTGGFFDKVGEIWHRGFGTGPRPEGTTPPEKPAVLPPLPSRQVGATPTDSAKEAEDKPVTTPEEAKKEEVTMGDKLAKLGKSLSGIKAPPKAELPKIGAPSVHQAHSTTPPNLSNLLALAGQLPSQHLNLTRLLGRSY